MNAIKSAIKTIFSVFLAATIFLSINIKDAKTIHLNATKIWIKEKVEVSIAPPSLEREIKREVVDAAYNIEKHYYMRLLQMHMAELEISNSFRESLDQKFPPQASYAWKRNMERAEAEFFKLIAQII